MLPDFRNDHFMQQMAQLSPLALNAYLLSLTALGEGLGVRFYRSQAEAQAKVAFFPAAVQDAVLFSVAHLGQKVRFFGSLSEREDATAGAVAANKSILKAKLAQAGVVTPFGGAVRADQLGVMEQLKAKKIEAVSVRRIDPGAAPSPHVPMPLAEAEKVVRDHPTSVFLVEQQIMGGALRVIASPRDVVSAQMLIPAHVMGDGSSSIEQLILQEVEQRQRHPIWASDTAFAAQAKALLERATADIAHVPPAGQTIPLHLPAHAHRVPVLDRMTPDMTKAVKDAAAAVGASVCAVHLVVNRAGKPFVTDVELRPSVLFDCFPYPNGEWNLDVPEYILRHHFPKHQGQMRQVLSYDFAALKAELFREGRTSKGVNAADFVTFG
jgi:hypothetical protein